VGPCIRWKHSPARCLTVTPCGFRDTRGRRRTTRRCGLYANFEDQSEYIDVPRHEVLKQAAAPEAAAPNGGVYAWVKPDAELVYTRIHSVTARARDLGGASARDAQLANEFRRRNPAATVLASLTVGTNALLFVEFRPGLTGIVESAPAGQSARTAGARSPASIASCQSCPLRPLSSAPPTEPWRRPPQERPSRLMCRRPAERARSRS
jgi:hypothetical protein